MFKLFILWLWKNRIARGEIIYFNIDFDEFIFNIMSHPREEGLADGQEDSWPREEESRSMLANGIEDSLPRLADSRGRRIACQGSKIAGLKIAGQGNSTCPRKKNT